MQPSLLISLVVFLLHFVVYGLVWLVQAPAIILALCGVILVLSNSFWLLRHWSMTPFVLYWTLEQAPAVSDEAGDSACRPNEPVTLQGKEADRLNPTVAELEWFHFELMIWSLRIESSSLARALELLAPAGDGRRQRIQKMCAWLWVLLPDHSFTWRLILWRRSHSPEFWRLLCQRVRLLG